MNVVMDLLSDLLLAFLGVVLTFIASRAGAFLARLFREKWKDESIRSVADTCVRAVEQMYREKSGSEKLDKALLMAERMLGDKGIRITAGELRYVLEAALCTAKDSFHT